MAEGLAREGRAYLAAELAEEPACAEERVFQEALRLGSKSMADELAHMRADQRAYRDYVETWVHEVKTPIAAARLAAANDPCPVAEAMDVELGRVEGFVDQALYYARSTSVDRDFQVREVVLADVARAAVRGCARTLIDAGVAPELTDLDLTVRADPKWLEFCLRQVLVNAAKYRRDAGALAGEPARVKLWARRRQTGLDAWETELFVEDNGVGIPACDLARVWDRGFTRRERPALRALNRHRPLPCARALRKDGPRRVVRLCAGCLDPRLDCFSRFAALSRRGRAQAGVGSPAGEPCGNVRLCSPGAMAGAAAAREYGRDLKTPKERKRLGF